MAEFTMSLHVGKDVTKDGLQIHCICYSECITQRDYTPDVRV